jgi:hypothetical protein
MSESGRASASDSRKECNSGGRAEESVFDEREDEDGDDVDEEEEADNDEEVDDRTRDDWGLSECEEEAGVSKG